MATARWGAARTTASGRIGAGLLVLAGLVICSPAGAADEPPANDSFADASPLPAELPITARGTLVGASYEADEPTPLSPRSVWYRWRPGVSGAVTIDGCGGEGPWDVDVYTGTKLTELTHVTLVERPGCGWGSLTSFDAVAGLDYRVRVSAAGSPNYESDFTLRLAASGPPPNDDFADAMALGAAPLTMAGRTLEATYAPGEPGNAVWYRWRSPFTGVTAFATCGLERIGAQLTVYEVGIRGPTLLADRSDGIDCPYLSQKQAVRVEAGRTYLIAASDSGRRLGYHVLHVTRVKPPANDERGDALAVPGQLPAELAGTTWNATSSPDDPRSSHRARSVWYSWEASANGRFRITDCVPESLHLLIYRAAKPSERSARLAPCNVGPGGIMRSRSFTVKRGEKVWIEASTRGIESSFSFGLEWDDSGPSARGEGPVAVATTNPEQHTRVRRLPISGRPGSKPRSVASLPIDRLGRLEGGRLEVGGELQLTVCLKPHFAHRSRRGDCAGRLYGYDPHISAYLALATSPAAAERDQVTPLSPTSRLTCKQKQPNRNHHCVITIPRAGIPLPGVAASSCAAGGSCAVNLIAAAHHRGARRGESVVIGGIDKSGRIDNKGKSQIFAEHFREGAAGGGRPLRGKRRRARLPVAPEGKGARMKVVYSQRIANPMPGEVLLVDGRYLGRIGSLPYNTRTRTAIVLADGPRSARHTGPVATRAAATTTRIAEESNFNCTHGPSAHRSPCPSREQGVLRFGKRAGKAVYVNLLAGNGAIGAGSERHSGRDRVRVGKAGYLRVRRYTP